MGGQVNRYTLNIIVDEKTFIPFAKGSLEMLDEVTSNFRNEQEFLDTIINELNVKIAGKKVKIKITYNQNKKTREMHVLYIDNKDALNKTMVGDKLMYYCANKNFVIQFVKRYCNSPYMSTLASDVIGAIESDEDYLETLQRIVDLTFSSYKSIRDIYFFIKNYEKLEENEKKREAVPQLNNKKELVTALKTLKEIYQCQQLDIFSLIPEEQTAEKVITDNGVPKIKK